MRVRFKTCVSAALLAAVLHSVAQQPKLPVLGTWKGESRCTVKPSPCHDETVVYEITSPGGAAGDVQCKADKIVNGEREGMGTLACTFASDTLTCAMPGKGVWAFTLRGDLMTGTLKLPDGKLYRRVTVKRLR